MQKVAAVFAGLVGILGFVIGSVAAFRGVVEFFKGRNVTKVELSGQPSEGSKQSEPQPEPESELQLQPQPESEPEPESELQLQPQPQPQPESEPEPESELQLQPQPQPQPESELQPQPNPQQPDGSKNSSYQVKEKQGKTRKKRRRRNIDGEITVNNNLKSISSSSSSSSASSITKRELSSTFGRRFGQNSTNEGVLPEVDFEKVENAFGRNNSSNSSSPRSGVEGESKSVEDRTVAIYQGGTFHPYQGETLHLSSLAKYASTSFRNYPSNSASIGSIQSESKKN